MDDVILDKIHIIEKCLKRIKEEYSDNSDELAINFTKQDSIILNLQRAIQAALDLSMHLVRVKKLGFPQNDRDVFSLLEEKKYSRPIYLFSSKKW